MSRINCPACDQKISLNEATCPHCGESIEAFAVKTKSTGMRIKDFGMTVITISMLFGIACFIIRAPLLYYIFFVIILIGLVLFTVGRFME